MNKRTSFFLGLAMLGAAGAASADCGADLTQLEPQVSEVKSASAKNKAQGTISLALEASQRGDEKTCLRLLKDAKKTARIASN